MMIDLSALSFEKPDKRICHGRLLGTNQLRVSAVVESDENLDSSQIIMFVYIFVSTALLAFCEVFLPRVHPLGAWFSTWSICAETS